MKLLDAIRDAYSETKSRWSSTPYLSLDCKMKAHDACTDCDCICHGRGVPEAQ